MNTKEMKKWKEEKDEDNEKNKEEEEREKEQYKLALEEDEAMINKTILYIYYTWNTKDIASLLTQKKVLSLWIFPVDK